MQGQGGAAPVIYTGFALRLCLDLLNIPRFAGPQRGRSCNCFATLLQSGWRYDPWQFNVCNIRNTSLARFPLTCIGPVRVFAWSWPRHLHPWCSATAVLNFVFTARKRAICRLAVEGPPCVYGSPGKKLKVGGRSFRVTARSRSKVRAVGACAAQH